MDLISLNLTLVYYFSPKYISGEKVEHNLTKIRKCGVEILKANLNRKLGTVFSPPPSMPEGLFEFVVVMFPWQCKPDFTIVFPKGSQAGINL